MRTWLLDIKNWSQLAKRYAHDEEEMYRNKRNILFSQITLLGSIVGILHALEGLVDKNFALPFLDFTMTVFVFMSYLINESGRHLTAKVLLLTFLNIFFFFYSLITPREIGIFVFYFPWVAVAALIFSNEERFWRIFFITLSIALLLVLFISDFTLLSNWRLPNIEPTRPFVFNVVSSILLTALFIYFMIHLSEGSEEKLHRLTSEIRQKNADLQRSNEQLDRFVYSASHDIKLPIISIKGLTHLANIDCEDASAKAYFSKIEKQADKVAMYLLEMLEYTRNNKTGLRQEKVNINTLVDEIIEDLSHLENAKRIEFKKFIRIEGEINIDRVRFMVILNNLLSNAIKYHNFDIEKPWVKIMISKVGSNIQVMVADNGLGINDQHKDKVFEMFFRASNSSLGSGLGLFIVKETVEKMNGKIMLSSKEGEGACFRIDLPLVA
ncbi:MAG TPA: HAMP domain-containing sensor histidine kinase [Cyclobacteriaceae bacterium]|nr:HAMP domain-containing sensor histidine kinase [Cyclobacteriaceae bacterium]